MSPLVALLLSASALSAPVLPTGGEPVVTPAVTSAYCDLVSAQAGAQSAPMMWPELFIGAGMMDSLTLADNPSMSDSGLSPRVIAGLSYSLAGLQRGLALRAQARASCQRQRAVVTLETALRTEAVLGRHAALVAQREELTRALPEAEAMLGRVRTAVAQGASTSLELARVRSRLEGLRSRLHGLAVELTRAEEAPRLEELTQLLQVLTVAETQLEQSAGSVRESYVWDLRLRAAYDQNLDSPRKVPFASMLIFSYGLGGLGTVAGNQRAQAARERWNAEDTDGLVRRAKAMFVRLSAVRDAERARLKQAAASLAELDKEVERLCQVETQLAKSFHDTLWFDALEARAEHAFLTHHLAELEKGLGGMPSP